MGNNSKYLYLVIGIVVGIALGAAVVWWMQNYDFKIWFTFSGKNENTTEFVENQTNRNADSENKQNANYNRSDKTNRNNQISGNSELKESEHFNETGKQDSLTDINNNDNDIVIAKDEYLSTRLIEVKGLNLINKNDNNLDSLLINDRTKNGTDNIIKVEFWRSPINYKGYKFINNKLILFGIYNYEEAILEINSNKLYLYYQNTYYLIERNTNFQPLIPSKLKK